MLKLNFFNRKNRVQESPVSSTVHSENLEKIPAEDLFIDNNPPKSESNKNRPEGSKSKLSAFLERDFYAIGKRDGYISHSKETVELWNRKTRSEFQLIMDQMIQEKREHHLTLTNHLASVGSLHETTSLQLNNRLNDLTQDINQLVKQKELSVDDEGWVMRAIHGYREGFTHGLNDYMEGEILINPVKTF